MQRNLKLWRESASIIILSKNFAVQDKWNYKILTVKRSKKMKFMPNLYTFPGGVIEKSDNVSEWLKLYETFGLKKHYFTNLSRGLKSPIFTNYCENELPRYISLRISAIRETFEECGILFCKSAETDTKDENTHWISCLGGHGIKEWQHIVQKDSSQFLEMCYKLKIYPDICALHEWSNWLTPYALPQQFDTIFFLAALQDIPPTSIDENEIEQLEWANPNEYLKWNRNRKIMLAPPQYYEISRLANFLQINNLIKYAYAQSIHGCERILPYRMKVAGKTITILPGDECYPDKQKLQDKNLTKIEIMPDCKTMHRIVHHDQYHNEIILENFTPNYNLPYLYKEER